MKKNFETSEKYWKDRYKNGGNSGTGSQGDIGKYKFKIISDFIHKNNIKSIIDFGCGDCAILKNSKYQHYMGFDISEDALKICREKYLTNNKYSFNLLNKYSGEIVDLSLSIDVIYHLVENDVYFSYLSMLFESSDKYVIIYSTNSEGKHYNHIKHRRFTEYISNTFVNFKLINIIYNKYSKVLSKERHRSSASFYIYEKQTN